MFQQASQFLMRLYGYTAEMLPGGAMMVTASEFAFPSGSLLLPTVVLKTEADQPLPSPNPHLDIIGVETPECPVVFIGIRFPHCDDDFGAAYFSTIKLLTEGAGANGDPWTAYVRILGRSLASGSGTGPSNEDAGAAAG